MSTLDNLKKFNYALKNTSISQEEENKAKYAYVNSIGDWKGDWKKLDNGKKEYTIKDEYRHLLPKDADNKKDKWAEFKTALNPNFTLALENDLKAKEIKKDISMLDKNKKDSNLSEDEKKQANFNYLKKIGSWNKEKSNAFEINPAYRGLAADELKKADTSKDKYAEFKIAMSDDFRKKLDNYLDKRIDQNKEKIQKYQMFDHNKSKGLEK